MSQPWSAPAPLPQVAAAPEVLCFGVLTEEAHVQALLATWRRFRSRHGDAIRWQNDGSGRWRKVHSKMWARFKTNLTKPKALSNLHSWDLHSSAELDGPDAAPALSLFIDGSGGFTLRWVGADDITEDARWLFSTLPIRWGYAGLGLLGPSYSDATGGRHDEVGDALLSDPLLGPTHPVLWGTPDEGVCSLGWATALGADFITALGGTEQVAKSTEALGLTCEALADHLWLRSGDHPAAASMEALRSLWTLLEPVRVTQAQLDDGWVPGLTLEEMTTWLNRWA